MEMEWSPEAIKMNVEIVIVYSIYEDIWSFLRYLVLDKIFVWKATTVSPRRDELTLVYQNIIRHNLSLKTTEVCPISFNNHYVAHYKVC